MYAVILAGGKGTRFWPLSREGLPKQYLRLAGRESLVQMTVKRLQPFIPAKNILIVSDKSQEKLLREHLPEIPERNLLFEPSGKNTAPAIALSAFCLRERDPKGIMAVFPADHIIKEKREFLGVLHFAKWIAGKDPRLITLGIRPRGPETGFGYIQSGDKFSSAGKRNVYHVVRFTEKPDRKTAGRFVKKGNYFWNAGIFVFSIETILKAFEQHLPRIHEAFTPLQAVFHTDEFEKAAARAYAKIEGVSIDYGIMEKAKDILVIPCDFQWSDVGSWSSLPEIMKTDKSENLILGEHIGLNTLESIIYSPDKLVTTIGLRDIIIIETKDTLLVCPKERAQDIKKMTELLAKKGKKRHL
jgi:mannose-1-phosphate guanylyltransferase